MIVGQPSSESEAISVGFQGESGAYSEEAARELFEGGIVTIPYATFEKVYEAVEAGLARYAMLPIENSLAGSIHRNYDLMLRHSLTIHREYNFRVSHCLLGLPGATLEQVRRAHSHPQALVQCERSLKRLGLEGVVEQDTAGSARLVRENGNPQEAAIASRLAAEVNGLVILVEHLEDSPENFTRFLALAAGEPEPYDPEGGEYKTSVVFSLNNVPGSLYRALSAFALRDIDLTKIESRPFQGRPQEYLFYIDFAGHIQEPVCERALAHLAEMAQYLRVLGSYPRHRYRPAAGLGLDSSGLDLG
jgi:prephenate dehydratase